MKLIWGIDRRMKTEVIVLTEMGVEADVFNIPSLGSKF